MYMIKNYYGIALNYYAQRLRKQEKDIQTLINRSLYGYNIM